MFEYIDSKIRTTFSQYTQHTTGRQFRYGVHVGGERPNDRATENDSGAVVVGYSLRDTFVKRNVLSERTIRMRCILACIRLLWRALPSKNILICLTNAALRVDSGTFIEYNIQNIL